MARIALSAVVAGVALLGVQLSGQSTFRSAYHDYRVVTFAEGLVQPWSIAFLPGGEVGVEEAFVVYQAVLFAELLDAL